MCCNPAILLLHVGFHMLVLSALLLPAGQRTIRVHPDGKNQEKVKRGCMMNYVMLINTFVCCVTPDKNIFIFWIYMDYNWWVLIPTLYVKIQC